MIDFKSSYNLIFQNIIARMDLFRDDQNIFPIQNLNKKGICLYQWHNMAVEIIEIDNTATFNVAKIYSANFTGCNLILGLSWLRKIEPSIKWFKNVVLFEVIAIKPVPWEAAAIKIQTTKVRNVNAALLLGIPQKFSNFSPAIACIGI